MKANKKINIITIIILSLIIIACKKEDKYEGIQDVETIKGYSNDKKYSVKMDSLEFITFITKQKLQEVYDLAVISTDKNSEKKLNSILKSQLKKYFLTDDSMYVSSIQKEMDSLKVKYIKIPNVTLLKKDSLEPDSIGYLNYGIKYYNQSKKLIISKERSAKYTLLKSRGGQKKEFKFYFTKLDEKDTIRKVLTK